MLRLMLNNHSRLHVPFESVFIPEFFHRQDEFGHLGHRANAEAMIDEIRRNPFVAKGDLVPDREAILNRPVGSYSELLDALFTSLAQRHGKVRWGDKTPSYIEDIDVLWSLFPGCRIIHLVRDGRAVATSLRTLSWGSRDLPKLARDWRWKVLLGRKLGSMIADHYLEVRYERLVARPVETLREICSFFGESYEDGMIRYHERAESAMPATSMRWHKSSVKAPDVAKADSWRSEMNDADQIIFEQIAGDALQMFGYETSCREPTIFSRFRTVQYALLGHA
jgi:hypothetical protein